MKKQFDVTLEEILQMPVLEAEFKNIVKKTFTDLGYKSLTTLKPEQSTKTYVDLFVEYFKQNYLFNFLFFKIDKPFIQLNNTEQYVVFGKFISPFLNILTPFIDKYFSKYVALLDGFKNNVKVNSKLKNKFFDTPDSEFEETLQLENFLTNIAENEQEQLFDNPIDYQNYKVFLDLKPLIYEHVKTDFVKLFNYTYEWDL